MDPLIIGFHPAWNQDLGDLQDALGSEFTTHSVHVVRAWAGDSADYFVVSPGPSVAQLQEIAASADAALTGMARLVVDLGYLDWVEIPAAEEIVRPHPGIDISLPSPGSFIDAEKFICPECGGINEHYSPPH